MSDARAIYIKRVFAYFHLKFILTSPCLVIVAIQISSKTRFIGRWSAILAP